MTKTLVLPAPPPTSLGQGMLVRLRAACFDSAAGTVTTVMVAVLVAALGAWLADWAVLRAVWSTPPGDAALCRAPGAGACWAVVAEKHRFLLFATYPYEEQWRPALACIVLVVLCVASGFRRSWTRWLAARWLMVGWLAGLTTIAVLMWGGVLGLPHVSQERWGGLPVTLLLAVFGIAIAFPLGVLLALGRRAEDLPVIRWLCVGYIELIRGVPLVSMLFMASFLLPLFLPSGLTVDKLVRALVAFSMYASAYLAEVVRGGLQSVPRGQHEAAMALGLGYWRATVLVILPQALRRVIPPLVNTFISLFKDTSLVLVIGVFDLLNAGKAAIVDPVWQAFGFEMFLAVSAIFFVFCWSMSTYSRRLEDGFGNPRGR
ncbi:amino acid ABC transporter permease [Azospirillum sp. RWY-5-1]|uniref:Amino acid ABC transporter permease n=1 Tax=Azospirillum oleiclasticum TaxID=2735135 RepID=A0ABX2TJK3_9PROT|nr:amino acid ABC transporter permease [Azospirillum oleiclasticum]NYZ14365.1 amino acid ABC transporter permease [Azospirillum oleiclasticum]NYZ23283.1 amino acid ABC transporter permease [Azospirillum oleiclasticum]